MKKTLMVVGILGLFMVCANLALAGNDATNCTMVIQMKVVNGTNAVEVTATYPSSWTSRAIQVSSDLMSTNNWRGLMLSEQIATKVNSPAGELPKWSKWYVTTESVIGPRFFRLKKM
jgi:hypothetical protein